MGLSFHCLNRLETGVDGLLELRDPVTQAMLAKWVGVQIKTKEKSRYTAESDGCFEYLLDPSDLAYWQGSNIPVIVVLVRLEDSTMFWKPVASGIAGEARRLVFDKKADGYNSAAADRIGSLCVEKGQLGTYVPPMMADDPLHLNLVKMLLPEKIFVGQSLFKSQREATKEMLAHRGPHYFDWVLRDRVFWSFRDPRGTVLSEVVDVDTVEVLDTAELSEQDDQDDENAFIDLLRRSVEAQVRTDLAFHKDSRSLYFRAFAPGRPRRYDYRALTNNTSADVVSIHEKAGREAVMRHHAFNPRYQRLGDDWFVSITPTFVFTVDGFSPHRASSVMLAGEEEVGAQRLPAGAVCDVALLPDLVRRVEPRPFGRSDYPRPTAANPVRGARPGDDGGRRARRRLEAGRSERVQPGQSGDAAVIFRASVIPEPLLEFGSGGTHVDPRFGLIQHGPLQAAPGDTVRVGIIGTGDTVDGMEHFLDRCRSGIEARDTPRPNLNPPFPGMGNQNPFRCSFVTDQSMQRRIPKADIRQTLGAKGQAATIEACASLFADQARSLLEGTSRPDVIVAALPVEVIQQVVNARADQSEDDEDDDPGLDFRDLFKAKTMLLRVPTQIVWPTLWDDDVRIPRKLKKTMRTVQDPATPRLEPAKCNVLQSGKGAVAPTPKGGRVQSELSRHRLLPRPRRKTAADEHCTDVRRAGARARVERSEGEHGRRRPSPVSRPPGRL